MQGSPRREMPFGEFVALVALLMATVAFSVDAMLPVLLPISADLAPGAPHAGHAVITVFMAGLGLGTFVMGPLSDAFGRRRVILSGIAVYMLASLVAAVSGDMTTLLAARFVQGLGASAPRVISQALVRDLYTGRMMARVLSFSVTIFTLVPAVAPLIGDTLTGFFGWRAIFWAFVLFGAITALWIFLRRDETLPPERRRALTLSALGQALVIVLAHRQVRLYLAALTFSFTIMLLWISSIAAIFALSFDRAESFPLWFAFAALLSAPSSLINARLVLRLGMERLVMGSLLVQGAVSLLALAGFGLELPFAGFALFMLFMLVQFFAHGFLIGNLYALALEPMGHVAGMTASVMGGVSTVGAAGTAALLTWLLNGTPTFLALASILCLLPAVAVMLMARRGA